MSAPPVFVSTTFLPDDTPVGEAIATCLAHGLRALELGSNHAHEPDPVAAVERLGLRCLVHNYFPPPVESFVVNLASLDDDVCRRSREHVARSLEYCRRIGALLYTVHPGFLSDPKGPSRGTGNYDFLFEGAAAGADAYERAYARMLDSLAWAVDVAARVGVPIAIETEGSVAQRDRLLLQRPEEFERLCARFPPGALGINLNIGHLRLASEAFGFSPALLVDVLAEHIVAMELSHNDGVTDDHRPLEPGAWYWDVIADGRFADTFRILEFRNVSPAAVVANVTLLQAHLAGRVAPTEPTT